MLFGNHVAIDGNAVNLVLNSLSNFSFSSIENENEVNQIIAADDETFTVERLQFCDGSPLNVWLRKENSDEAAEFCHLADLFPKNELVAAMSNGRLAFFAPVCNSKMELVSFLVGIDEFFRENKNGLSCFAHDRFIDLALWLYKHNPAKLNEPRWDI